MASVLDIIKHYQQFIEKYSDNEEKVLKCINKLYQLRVTVQHLQETGVGRTVNALRKEPGEVGQAARTLVLKWKMMVAAEESDQEGDHKNDTSAQNGHSSGRESDDHSHQSKNTHERHNSTKPSTPKLEHKEYHKDNNGHHSGSKRKYHSSEEEDNDAKKKPRPISSSEDDHKKQIITKKENLSDSESSDDDSESSDSDSDSYSSDSSQEEVKVKKEKEKEKKQSPERHRSSSKHSQSNDQKRESCSSRKHESDQHSHHKSTSKDVPRHSSESSSKSSSHKHKSSHEKENTEKKHKSDTSSDEKKESKSSTKHSSDKHKSSSHSSSSERHKSSSDKSSSKEHKSSHTEKTPEKHKTSSEKDTSKHKSRESSNSSKDKHGSSSKEKSKERNNSSKERSSHSHSSDKRHSSSDSKSQNSDKSKHKSDDGSTEKKSKEKSSSSSSHKSKSSGSSSKSKEDVPKKKSKLSSEESGEDGIDCGSGASFAEALGMISPTKSKKKSLIKDSNSPNNSYSTDLTPAALLAPSVKLAPLPLIEISALPEISPNYKPRPPPKLLPNFSDEDAISAGISSKNQRTKVYSGNKVIGKITSLYEMCVHVLQEHIDALEYTGGVPYEILKPVVDRATPQQLFLLEHYNPYLMEDTDHLWNKFCEKNFRNKKRQELESWREMYIRCQEEQEHRLKSLTANIRMTQEAKKAPIKQTKMAYVDSVVKPPRNIARKQALHGTAHSATASPAARVASLSATPGVLKTGSVRPPPSPSVSASSFNKPKKAPLMQKALQFMRGRKR